MEPTKGLQNEVKVTARFVGEKVDPEIITSKLGIQPSETHVKGELSKKRSKHAWSTGYWGIDSPCSPDQAFEKHIEVLLELLEPKLLILQHLREEGISLSFYCGFFVNEPEGSFFTRLNPVLLERLGRIGASLDCWTYCCIEKEDSFLPDGLLDETQNRGS